MKTDWTRKLASRKFWALLAGFVGSLLVAFNVGENEIAQVTAVLTAFGSVAVYILTEGAIDKAAVNDADKADD
ncbi:hypothetical protein [Sporosarcina koreensis]|uniref:hypothetical protein n=1 Tax=Sporosarcina koreensis TaxID=334735 RepID=UPI000751E74B|nr:hypothetical protein [Sporosarcina koreensis]